MKKAPTPLDFETSDVEPVKFGERLKNLINALRIAIEMLLNNRVNRFRE